MNAKHKSAEAEVKVAVIQMEPLVARKEQNVTRTVELIEEAARDGAQLLVLPELCNSGHVFESRAEAFEYAEPIPEGPTCQRWAALATARGLYLVAGIEAVNAELNAFCFVYPEEARLRDLGVTVEPVELGWTRAVNDAW